jgi:NodT family efflux transporter outer membrane factor (OMF) lipoprotein
MLSPVNRGNTMVRKFQSVAVVLVFAGIIVSLSACKSLGPDYSAPSVEWIEKWESDLYGAVSLTGDREDESDLSFWWAMFDDPVLNRLITLARAENPSLRIAGLRILESRSGLGVAKSSLYPQVRQGGGSSLFTQTRQSGGNFSDSTDNIITYQTGLNAAWELDFWGKFRRGVESADASFFASIANQQNIQVLLSAQVAELYFRYRTFLLRIQIANENAAIQKRSFEITDHLYRSGEDSELDLQQAKTQYMATLSSIPGLEESAIQTRNALCALVGRAPGQLPELDETAQELPVVPPVAVQGIPAQLLLRRPDLRVSAWQVAAQSPKVGQAKADLYPSVSLLGSVGWSGNYQSGSNIW